MIKFANERMAKGKRSEGFEEQPKFNGRFWLKSNGGE